MYSVNVLKAFSLVHAAYIGIPLMGECTVVYYDGKRREEKHFFYQNLFRFQVGSCYLQYSSARDLYTYKCPAMERTLDEALLFM